MRWPWGTPQVINAAGGVVPGRAILVLADGANSEIDFSSLTQMSDTHITVGGNTGLTRFTLTARALGTIQLRPSPFNTFVTDVFDLEETSGKINGLITLGPGSIQQP